MATACFETPGRFYRGNLHTHSTRSDGVLDPAEVARRYREEGYDFIALTDHFVGVFNYPITDTSSYRQDGFTTILGAELRTGAMQNGEIWHILAVGLPADFAPPEAPGFVPVAGQESAADIAARARDAGAFVSIAHPEWSGLTMEDARTIAAAHAVEIYNHGCAVDCDRAHGFHAADLLLTEGRAVTMIATDDAHFASLDHFGGWVMVNAAANQPDLLLQALKDGAFYSTTGPEIRNIILSVDRLQVECSPAASVIVQGQGTVTAVTHGIALIQAELPLARFSASPWIRVTMIDGSGKPAWSNPIWLT